jgi:hypothetical protein
VALVSNFTWPYGIVTDDAFVYFTTYDAAEGAVWRVPKAGGTAEPLAEDLDFPSQLVLVGGSLYVTESGADRVFVLSKTGGLPVSLATGQDGPSGITSDGTTLYWTNYFGDQIVSSDLQGNTKILASPTDPFRIAAGTDRVYYTALGPDVRWVMKDGSAQGTIPSPSPRSVAFGRNGKIHWTDGGVLFANPDGSELMSFGDLEDGIFWDGLALDDDHLFAAVTEGDIVRFSLHGEQPVILVTGQDLPTLVALDESCVYWTNTGLTPGTGSVMRAPRETITL